MLLPIVTCFVLNCDDSDYLKKGNDVVYGSSVLKFKVRKIVSVLFLVGMHQKRREVAWVLQTCM